MIVDKKLKKLIKEIAQHFKARDFLICYDFDKVMIISMDYNSTALIQVNVSLNDLTNYPAGTNIYVLPVVRNCSVFDDDWSDNFRFSELRKFELTTPEDSRYLNTITGFNKHLYNDECYVSVPYDKLIYELNQIEKHFDERIPRFHLRFGEYHSVLSVNLLQRLFFTNNIENVDFKLLDNCNPVFVKYDCVFNDMLVNVAGVVAPVVNENYDYFIRVK